MAIHSERSFIVTNAQQHFTRYIALIASKKQGNVPNGF